MVHEMLFAFEYFCISFRVIPAVMMASGGSGTVIGFDMFLYVPCGCCTCVLVLRRANKTEPKGNE